jgi:hypothetical protein
MTDEEYKKIVELAYSNKVLIGIDRIFARKFYTDISLSKIRDETYETPCVAKSIVWFAFLCAPVSLVASLIITIFAFRWWAIAVIPSCIFVYYNFSSMSCMGRSRMSFITIILILTTFAHFTTIIEANNATLFLFVYVFSLWCIRFLYCSSTFLLRCFVLRNKKAFEFISDWIRLKYTNGNEIL